VVHQTLTKLLRTKKIGVDYPEPSPGLDINGRHRHYWDLTKTIMQAYEKRPD
jgi:hypothetical protein